MVLNFALSLSFDGIVLLHRVGAGWVPIGEVPLDAEDLDAAMAALRKRGLATRQGARRVGLIIPNDQIRYLDRPDPGADEDTRDAAIRAALDGATPYSVDELAFDHTLRKGRLQIAAVARETLEEAEAFALQHGFKPAAFLAIAPEDAFDGAVFFGIPGSWSGPNRPDRPESAIRVLPAGAWPPAEEEPDDLSAAPPRSVLPPSPPEQQARATPEPEQGGMAEPEAEIDPIHGLEQEGEALPEPQPEAASLPEATSLPEAQPEAISQPEAEPEATSLPEAEPPPGPQARDGADAEPAATAAEPEGTGGAMSLPPLVPRRDAEAPLPRVSFASIRATREDASGAAPPVISPPLAAPPIGAASQPERRFTPVLDPASGLRGTAITGDRIQVDDGADTAAPSARFLTGRAPLAAETPPEAPLLVRPEAPVKPRETPEPAARAPRAPGPARPPRAPRAPEPPAARQPLTEAEGKSGLGLGIGRLAAFRRDAEPAPRDLPPGGGAAVIAAEGASGFATTSASERERMTVFGARNRERVGGKPRFLGLMLTLALLLFLAGVAAWASVFLDEGLARFFRPGDEPRAVASLPKPAPEAERPGAAAPAVVRPEEPAEPEEEQDEDLRIAALETMPDSGADAPPALAEPDEPRELSAEEAAATYAATGIWQRAPGAPQALPTGSTDSIYVASIDPGVRQFDAVALPDPVAIGPEAGLSDPGLPPPSDLFFDFDARGLIRATPEGALSPEGLRIFTGRPAVVPPLRQDAAPGTPDAAADDGATLDPALAAVRPEARPDDIVEQFERAGLGGISRDELAAMRPVMRPPTAQEEAAAAQPDAPGTAQAVARSLIPVPRPRDMQNIVSRAQPAPPVREEVQVASVATVAPRVVQPPAPSSTNVARAATVRNAIRLNEVNLIGVYGTPNSRRALVRMPNGRYEKVKVGDRLDGGRVTAIGEAALQYQKGGRTLTLAMPRG